MSAKVLRSVGPEALAEAVAQRLQTALADAQSGGRVASLCLTGGRIAGRIYRRLGEDAATGSPVDWARVELWWGDERYVSADSPDRNDAEALTALSGVALDPARLHPMPSTDAGLGLAEAAARYAAELAPTPFDVCLLGVGPDGHVASLFPDHPSSIEGAAAGMHVLAVRNSPKPPPDRISLSFAVLNASRQVWFVVSGEEKADAVARAATGVDPDLPAARVHGTDATLWLVDDAAASRL